MLHYSINAKIAYFWMHFPFYGEIFYQHDSQMRINKPITSPKHPIYNKTGISRPCMLVAMNLVAADIDSSLRTGMTCTGNCHSHDWKDLKKH